MEYTLEDAKELIRFTRDNIEHYLKTGKRLSIPKELEEKYAMKGGAFVTLNKYYNPKETDLRGCIGIILPYYPLIETIHNVSISAAVEDPRFPRVSLEEMDKIIIEISILSVPELIKVSKPEDYFNKIVIGRDGLIVSRGSRRGLLLPQVPIEHGRNWDVKTFLEHTCQKAWLPPDAWKDIKNTKIERFSATVYEEIEPRGEVRKKKLWE